MEELYNDARLARFYDLRAASRDDLAFCAKLAKDARAVLDLGCGTGELAVRLSQGRMVAGVDPAAAMLEIARNRPGAENVRWVEADARTVRLRESFDLVVMTGHSFQVFLDDMDQHAVLSTIAAHLAPGGCFVFDSRNPDFPGRKTRERAETMRFADHSELGRIEAWNESYYDETRQILTYENGYKILRTGETASAEARIRYTSRAALETRIGDAGLSVTKWFGDWRGGEFDPQAREIIPLGGLVHA